MNANQEIIQEIAGIANNIQSGLTIIAKKPCTIEVVHFLSSGSRFTFKVNTTIASVKLNQFIGVMTRHVQAGTATGIPSGRFVQVDSNTYHFWID
ncbi:MAG: hypothetical protein ACRCU2_29095 [Planktothrix sp.]